MNSNVLKPIIQAILACFLWGFVFAMPVYLESFSSLDIVLGRFMVYGSLSVLLLLFSTCIKKDTSCLKYWKEATLCAIVMNLIYFVSLIYGSRFTAPSIITLIIGTGPITITVFSCLLKSDRKLLNLFVFPSVVIFFGLCLISIEAIKNDVSSSTLFEHVQGLLFGLISLTAWTWYVIFNSKVLRTNHEIKPVQWTALIGTITFMFTLVGVYFQIMFNENEYFTQFSWELGKDFWIGILILGIFCSWAAFTLWSMAGSRLHPALVGQLSILETIFGVALIYTFQGQLPSMLEISGAFCMLLGVSWGLYSFTKSQSQPNEQDLESLTL